jgi:23S rRNA (guanosine2251-2'-O)-methyltransferase
MNNRGNGNRETSGSRQSGYGQGSSDRRNSKGRSYGHAADGERKSYGRADGERKSYGRADGERKSYGRADGERKSYGRADGERKSYSRAQRSYGHREYDYSTETEPAETAEAAYELQEQQTAETVEDGGIPENSLTIEGRNAVLEAFRSGKTIDKLYVLDGCTDGPVATIRREAKKQGTIMKFVSRERLDQISATGKHQGVIACAAAYDYSEIDDIFALAEKKGEAPFIFILDNIEDPHNLGAMIRTANVAGAHGVIIPRNRAVGLTATVAKTSAGALNYTPVVKVTNIAQTIEELKKRGVWFACADMEGTLMYDLNLTGAIGLVIGNEGAGVGKLVREKCDMVASIPMKGEIESLNASVAAGVLAYEIVRQRSMKK